MAQVVKLMAELWIVQPALLMNPRMRRSVGMHRPPGVEIAVRFLRGSDAPDHLLQLRGDGWVWRDAEAKRGALNGFVNVRIVERILRRRLVLKTLLVGRATAHRLGGKIR